MNGKAIYKLLFPDGNYVARELGFIASVEVHGAEEEARRSKNGAEQNANDNKINETFCL